MCTITLSYNESDKVASEKLAALLSTGLFVQLHSQQDAGIEYSDSSLYEEDMSLSYEKDEYTPEELREMLIYDLDNAYGVK